jgi:hypothetical protein
MCLGREFLMTKTEKPHNQNRESRIEMPDPCQLIVGNFSSQDPDLVNDDTNEKILMMIYDDVRKSKQSHEMCYRTPTHPSPRGDRHDEQRVMMIIMQTIYT